MLPVDVVGVFFFFFLMRENQYLQVVTTLQRKPLFPFLCFSVTVLATAARALR